MASVVFVRISVKDEIKFAVNLRCFRKVYCEMVSKYYKIRNKSGGNNSIKAFQLYLRVDGLSFVLFLNSAIQIILEICLVAIIVMCGVVTTIEGTQRSKRFFLTLEYKDSTRPGVTMIFCRGLELLIVTNSSFR